MKLLVVEDEKTVRELLLHVFEGEGYEVTEAATSEDALLAIGSDTIDIVILDLVLGPKGKAGLQVLRDLRSYADTARIPVIILTGHILTERDQEQIRADQAYVFYKPLKISELLAYVARLIPHAVP